MEKMMAALLPPLLLLLADVAMGDLAHVRAEEELRKSLLENYDKTARPSGTVTIYLSSITILNFEMHEVVHSVDLHTYCSFTWRDERLKWTPDSHSNIKQIGMNPDAVWKPDLSVYNAAVGPSTFLKSQMPSVLFPSGKLLFVPVYHFHFSCLMDLTYWPHDTHNCSLKLGSWIHSGMSLDLDLSDFYVDMKVPSMIGNDGRNMSRTEWNITEIKAVREVRKYACCEEPYPYIYITMLITRNAPAFAWTVKMPAACLSVLTLAMFLLPPGAGEKLIFGSLCLVLDLLYIDYTSYAINHAPSHTPLIVQLVCQQVALLMVSLIVSAIVVRIARDPHSSGLPPMIKGPITAVAYILCLGNYANLASGPYSTFARTIKSDEVELGDECMGELRKKELTDRNEWLLLAAVIDRVFFLLYLAICIISLIRFSSVL